VLTQIPGAKTADDGEEVADGDIVRVVQPTEQSVRLANTDNPIYFIDETEPKRISMSTTTIPSFLADTGAEEGIPQEVDSSSVANITALLDHQSNQFDSGYDKTNSDKGQEPGTVSHEDSDRPTEDPGKTESQNAEQEVRPPRRPVIVVSDGLLSDRMDEDEREGTASGVSNLLSSASVAGAVALTLIVMATVTVLVSLHRNRTRKTVADNEMEPVPRQQQPMSRSEAYNYTQDVSTLPRESRFAPT
jgi:hypothetical protein